MSYSLPSKSRLKKLRNLQFLEPKPEKKRFNYGKYMPAVAFFGIIVLGIGIISATTQAAALDAKRLLNGKQELVSYVEKYDNYLLSKYSGGPTQIKELQEDLNNATDNFDSRIKNLSPTPTDSSSNDLRTSLETMVGDKIGTYERINDHLDSLQTIGTLRETVTQNQPYPGQTSDQIEKIIDAYQDIVNFYETVLPTETEAITEYQADLKSIQGFQTQIKANTPDATATIKQHFEVDGQDSWPPTTVQEYKLSPKLIGVNQFSIELSGLQESETRIKAQYSL